MSRYTDGTARRHYRAEIGRLPMPVRMVWGEADGIVPVETADGLPPHVHVRRIPAIGHAPHLEAPDAVVAAIREAIGTD